MGRLWHIKDNFAPPGSTGRQRARPVISPTTVIAIGRALTERSGTRSAIVYCGHHMIDQNEEPVVGRSSPPHADSDEEDEEPHEQAGTRGAQDTENLLHAEHYQGFATCVGRLGTVSLTPSGGSSEGCSGDLFGPIAKAMSHLGSRGARGVTFHVRRRGRRACTHFAHVPRGGTAVPLWGSLGGYSCTPLHFNANGVLRVGAVSVRVCGSKLGGS